MSLIGNLLANLAVDTREWEAGLKKGMAGLSKFEQESIKRLKAIEKQAAQSRLDKALGADGSTGLDKVLRVGAIVAVGNALANVTKKAVEMRDAYREGAATWTQMSDSIAGAIPLIGKFWETGRNIRELWTGENAADKDAAAQVQAEAARANAVQAQQLKVRNALIENANNAARDLAKEARSAQQQEELGGIQDETDRAIRAVEMDRDNRIAAIREQVAKARDVNGQGLLSREQAAAALKAQNNMLVQAQEAEIAVARETETKKAEIWQKADDQRVKEAAQVAKVQADAAKKAQEDAVKALVDEAKDIEKFLADGTKASKFEVTSTSNQTFKGGSVFIPPDVFRPMTAEQKTANARLEQILKELQAHGVKVVSVEGF